MLKPRNDLHVASIIESDAALTPTAGDKLFDCINESLRQQTITIIDFEGIRFITSAFLNASVGQLYAHYDSNFIKKHLEVKNLSPDDLILLARVVERAKEYFADKDNVEAALRQVLHD